jgi:hypothetical protein
MLPSKGQGSESIEARDRVVGKDQIDLVLFERGNKILARVHAVRLAENSPLSHGRRNQVGVDWIVFEEQEV